MQLDLRAQERVTVHGQYCSVPVQRVPRLGETSVQVAELAFHAPATATPPLAVSEYAPPASMQNPRAQETALAADGLPSCGGNVPAQVLPFQFSATESCTGSCETFTVPTAMQSVALPQETCASPHGPGGPPPQMRVGLCTRHLVPSHARTTWLCTIMHEVRLPQDAPATPPFGLGIVRQPLPFQRSAPVGPP